ncbi:hypothetical protein D3C75_1094060 [compost metagenome]
MQAVLLILGAIVITHRQQRRTRLAVPAAEQRQIDVGSVFHCLHKIVTGGRTAVVTFEIELHPRLELLFPQQRVQHADHFGSFLIHRQGVEVVHLDHFIRPDRVRHRAGVFGELRPTHHPHVIDAVD